jgi:hypothetical protein
MRSAARPDRRLLLASIFVCLATIPCLWAVAASAAERNSALTAALESINAAELKAPVDYLASDALEGREPGTRGGRMAGDYLAGRLAEMHLAPGGIDGGYFQPFEQGQRNVLARLSGSDPKLKSEVILIGAHYDHVGYGNSRNSRGPTGFIHPGADDNASGVSGLLCIARAFTTLPQAPKRTVLFAFWDAEEKGMLGSKHWLAHPTVPRQQLRLMLCLDMIGRLRNDRLTVFGSRSGFGLRRLVASQNEGLGLVLDFDWGLRANSDHYAFFQERFPVLLVHAGLHDDYHRPSDKAELIDSRGMARAVRLWFGVAYEAANAPQTPAFREAAGQESPETQQQILQQVPVLPSRLGVAWSPHESAAGGVRLTEVARGSPAERAGLRPGDRVLKLAEREIRSFDDFSGAVMSAVNPASIVIQRPGEPKPQELKAELDGQPMRVGILWRADDAEPGAAILTYVVPGSPAARAGLLPGDRVYQVAGRDFANDEQFERLLAASSGPLPLLVERNGQVRTVLVRFEVQPLKRAA